MLYSLPDMLHHKTKDLESDLESETQLSTDS